MFAAALTRTLRSTSFSIVGIPSSNMHLICDFAWALFYLFDCSHWIGLQNQCHCPSNVRAGHTRARHESFSSVRIYSCKIFPPILHGISCSLLALCPSMFIATFFYKTRLNVTNYDVYQKGSCSADLH